MKGRGKMADVFISKSTRDDEIALSICDVLEKSGIDCWISNRDLNTKMGNLYANDIVDAILESKVLLLILSKNSNRSRHVINEVSTACDNQIKVFAFQIDDVIPNKTFDYYLSQEQRIIDEDALKTGNYYRLVKELTDYFGIMAISADFVDDEYVRKANFRKLKSETIEKRQSYSMSIAYGTEQEYDSYHLYESIERFDIVDDFKNTWSSYRFLTIRNESDVYTNHIIHKECGENKVSFTNMRIRAYIGQVGGERLSVESLTTIQPNAQQLFKINFKQPLKPGESITIFYRLDWPNEPGAYYMEELSQSISLIRYKKGVGKIVFGIYEPNGIISSHLLEVSRMNETKPSNYDCEQIKIENDIRLSPLHGKGYQGLKYVIDKPNAILYQILYKVQNIENNDNEDDIF